MRILRWFVPAPTPVGVEQARDEEIAAPEDVLHDAIPFGYGSDAFEIDTNSKASRYGK